MKKVIMVICLITAAFSFSAFAATDTHMANKNAMMQQMSQADQANMKMMSGAMEQMMNKKMTMMGMKMMMMGMKMYGMGDMMMVHNMGDMSKAKEMMMMGASMYKMGKTMTGGKDMSQNDMMQ